MSGQSVSLSVLPRPVNQIGQWWTEFPGCMDRARAGGGGLAHLPLILFVYI